MKERLVVVAATMLAAQACSGGARGTGDWAGLVRDSAGVTIVENPATGMWADDGAWRVEPTVTIGAAEGDEHLQFGQIAGMSLTEAGAIRVLDVQAAEVRVFESDGSYRNTIGRKGNGPGEIALGMGVFQGSGDTILVPDMSARRVNRFLPDGTDAGSAPLDLSKGIPAKFEATPSGRLVAQLRPFTGGGGTPVSLGANDVIAAFGPEPGVLDTLLTMPAGETVTFSGDIPQIEIFAPEPMWTVGEGNAVYLSRNDQVRVSKYIDGKLATLISRAVEPQPVTEGDERLIRDAVERSISNQGTPRTAMVERILGAMSIADRFPTLLQLMSGPDGTLWVQRFTNFSEFTEEERENFDPLQIGSRFWEVYDSDGRFLGEVDMPERFQPLGFHGDKVYGVWRDELDVQYAMIATIQRS